jgi:histidinol-phosphate aminotransferase
MKLKKYLTDILPYSISKRNKNRDEWLYLDWNESGYNSNELIEYISEESKKIKYNLYPDENTTNLIGLLSKYNNVLPENISIYNGSDSALKDIFDLYLNENDKVFRVNPNYTQIDIFIQTNGGQIITYNPENIFDFSEIEIAQHIPEDVKIIYISNPNNPIGYLHSKNFIKSLLEKFSNSILILDEAYSEFCLTSYTDLIEKYENLIITKTFSKAFGLASLRIGYIVTSQHNIEDLNKIKNVKQVNQLGLVAAEYMIKNFNIVENYIKQIKKSKLLISENLKDVKMGFGNFFLYKPKEHDGFNKFMLENKVLIRDRSIQHGLNGYYRITITDENSVNKLIKLIEEYESR